MQEQNALISVIVPVYDVEQYLPECLDSLLDQTWKNLELILVDDGSPDNSWDIMERYAAKDGRVRIFRKENGGVSAARNFGLEQARGEYIAFVDPDDWVETKYLEWLYRALEQENTQLSLCEVRGERERAVQRDTVPDEMPETVRVTPEMFSYFNRFSCVQIWRSLYHRDLLEGLRFDTTFSVGEDVLFWTQVFLKTGAFAFVDAKLYHYFYRKGSAMRQKFVKEKRCGELRAWERILEMARPYPLMYDSAKTRQAMTCSNIYFHMAKSGYRDEELKKEMIRTARGCGKAAFRFPPHSRKQLLKVLLLVFCPELGWKIWGHCRKEAG